ncbi:hypothetical protein DFH08DRAFT_65963 [Mycena albidolilacea]|uniref:F-box domain-containing protein n=1 Tax=Mycena albidolilacea TaxID=1033008 RepID=A0AAD7ABB5_9AGAR|nr:hypothetical protein DFH08DRAFT_65963 [Mycena albidolilacea]
MNWVPNAAADNLPDELLATILKLVADFPVPSSARTPPAPVAASRVSRRWRTVALGSPELWTNIRISHRSPSQSWAATFVKRSLSRPLDISISLESYREWDGMAYDNPVPVSRALAIVGPHIGRWRTLALRGWSYQLQEFLEFIGSTPAAASQLEYTHLSAVDDYPTLPPLEELFRRKPFHSLRVNALEVDDATPFKAVRSLDIDCDWSDIGSLRPLFGPCSPLTTLVMRNFCPPYVDGLDPIDCSTIRSFAVSFSRHFYSYDGLGGFETLTNTLSLPNIEHLEILGGFAGARNEDRLIEIPEDWEAPLFPHLRTLRLEDMGFSRAGLAFIQSFSRNITALQLINTTGNERLLVQPGGWPALRALAVETRAVVPLAWIASFVALRSALGGPILDLALPPWGDGLALAACDLPKTVIQWQRSGPSRALMDGVYGPGFYIDEYDMRPADFAHVPYPEVRKCRCCGIDWSAYPAWKLDLDMELLEEDIERDFKAEGEVVRAKWTQRGARRQRRRGRSASRGSRAKRFPRNQRHGVVEDFSVV